MKKPQLLSLFASFLIGSSALAQTTGTFIVADKGNRMASCQDTSITLNDIYNQLAIRDLNDGNEDASNYRILQLNGSVITSTEITNPFKFSDYETVYVEKKNSQATGHNGLVVYINLITRPAFLFKTDTLKYTVDKGTKANIGQDFFNNIEIWSSGKDVLPFQERLWIKQINGTLDTMISKYPDWTQLGPGLYKFTFTVSVCNAQDLMRDSLFVKVTESLCHNISIKNNPTYCRDAMADITPFVYVDGHQATATELADMTFYDRSNLTNPSAGAQIDPAAFDMKQMYNRTNLYPNIEIVYQPNVVLGGCAQFTYMPDTKVPSKLLTSNVLMPADNFGGRKAFGIDGTYYSFNNVFHKNVLQELYLNNFNVYSGTSLHFYTDNKYMNEITANDISAGDYYLLALNPNCADDSAMFTIQVKERDFEILWNGAQNQGKGYYTFTAPAYSNATYQWFVWGGAIVAGLGTNQVTVYYSENAAPGVTVTCTVTLPTAKTAEGSGVLASAVYLKDDGNGNKEEIKEAVSTGNYSSVSNNFASVYPNPTDGAIQITGEQELDVKIYNTLGILVYEQQNYSPNTFIHLEGSGIHIMYLTQNDKKQTIKVVLK